jgi:hypothetical protein
MHIIIDGQETLFSNITEDTLQRFPEPRHLHLHCDQNRYQLPSPFLSGTIKDRAALLMNTSLSPIFYDPDYYINHLRSFRRLDAEHPPEIFIRQLSPSHGCYSLPTRPGYPYQNAPYFQFTDEFCGIQLWILLELIIFWTKGSTEHSDKFLRGVRNFGAMMLALEIYFHTPNYMLERYTKVANQPDETTVNWDNAKKRIRQALVSLYSDAEITEELVEMALRWYIDMIDRPSQYPQRLYQEVNPPVRQAQ